MKYITLFLGALFSFSNEQGYSQKIKQGYILTDSGDSLSGYIFRDKKKTKHIFLFKSSSSSSEKDSFSIQDCKGFGFFKPVLNYERWIVSMDMSWMDKDFNLMNVDSVKTDTVFLENIYGGSRISLYHYKDVKDHYFVKFNGVVEELILRYTKPIDPVWFNFGKAPHHSAWYIFRDQLYKYFDWKTNHQLRIKVDFAEYDTPALVSIIRQIDKEKSKTVSQD
jgi:hypothetical protein